MLAHLSLGLAITLMPLNLFCVALGTLLGILVGAIPGMHASTAIILLTPITLYLDPIPAFLLSVAIYCGELFGGSVTAILFNIPGTAAAIPTTFDGYPMTKKNKSGEALVTAIYSSAIGGEISVVAMILLVPLLAKIALGFGPTEFFALAVMGMAVISSIAGKAVIKGTIMALWGLLLATVGMDNITGMERFTFGSFNMSMGISFIIVLLGILPLAEVFYAMLQQFGQKEGHSRAMGEVLIHFPSFHDVRHLLYKLKFTILKSSFIGLIIGILPGAGGTIAAFLSYGEAVRSSDQPELFGTGIAEGVAAPESANNASSGGAMVPMLTLGIPGSETTAILLGLLVLHGLRPGPTLLLEAPRLVYSCFIGMFISNILIIVLGVFLAKMFVRLLHLPEYSVYPGILLLCIVAAFNLRNSLFDVWLLLIFGLIGLFMKKYKWPAGPLILGMILGGLLEDSFRRALLIYDGDWLCFVKQPLSAAMLLVAVLAYLTPFIRMLKEKRKNAGA